MVFAGEASWRWKMQRPADDHLYEMFWRQAARWLSAPAPDPMAIDVDQDVRPGTPAEVGVVVRDRTFTAIRDASVEVVVRDDHGRTDAIAARLIDPERGRYVAEWQPTGRGLYHVSARATLAGKRERGKAAALSAERALLSGGADRETADPRVHHDVLARLAERSGGRVAQAGDLAAISRTLRARADAAPTVAVREVWHGPWTFAVIVSLLGSEWAFRRRWGLR